MPSTGAARPRQPRTPSETPQPPAPVRSLPTHVPDAYHCASRHHRRRARRRRCPHRGRRGLRPCHRPSRELRQGRHGRCADLPGAQRGGHRRDHQGAGLPAHRPPDPGRAGQPAGRLDGAGDHHQAQDPGQDGRRHHHRRGLPDHLDRRPHPARPVPGLQRRLRSTSREHGPVDVQDAADLLRRKCRPLDRGGTEGAGRAGEPGAGAPADRRGHGGGRRFHRGPAGAEEKPSAGTTKAAATSDSTARGLGIAGLVVGVLGLAAAGFALARGRTAGAAAGTPRTPSSE